MSKSMSRSEPGARRRGLAIGAILLLAAVIVGTGLVLQEYGPGNMGTGFLQGAAVGTIVVLVALWRITRHPDRTTTVERAWTRTGDERDDALLTRALAVLGILAFPLTAVATIAIALGALVPMVLFMLLMAQVGVFVVAFLVIARRS